MLDLVSETLPYPRAWLPGPPVAEPKEGQESVAGTHTETGLSSRREIGQKNYRMYLKYFIAHIMH